MARPAISGAGPALRVRQGRHAMARAARNFAREISCPYYLSACLIFKNSASYLAEWIEFHRLVGFEHFFLYNNDSTDHFEEVLAPYLRMGLVTLTHRPGPNQQMQTYEYCLRTDARRSRWVAFFDDDEFLFSPRGRDLREVLEGYEEFPGVWAYWMLFGFSGHARRPPGLVIENFIHCEGRLDDHAKSLLQPARIRGLRNPHEFYPRGRRHFVNEQGVPARRMWTDHPTADALRINHYVTKSLEECLIRLRRGRPNPGPPRTVDQPGWRRIVIKKYEVEDRAIQRYLPALRDALEAGPEAASSLPGAPARRGRWARAVARAASTFRDLRPRRYFLAACLTLGDGERLAAGWVDFHRAAGFDHVFILQRTLAAEADPGLRPFIDAGLLSWTSLDPALEDAGLYRRGIELAAPLARWAVFLRPDEYMAPLDAARIPEVLLRHEANAAVAVGAVRTPRTWAGASDRRFSPRDPGLRGMGNEGTGALIFRPRYVEEMLGPASLRLRPGGRLADDRGRLAARFGYVTAPARELCIYRGAGNASGGAGMPCGEALLASASDGGRSPSIEGS